MKVRIEDDVFEICRRIKEIDNGYFVLYNQNNCKYEIHNFYQKNTYCCTVPFDCLDSRVVDTLLYNNIKNIDNIVYDIDKNNAEIENVNMQKIKDEADYKIREIYKFANSSSRDFDDSFAIEWR